ncbi:ABC transporter domain-containing protein [Trichoderma breve]|uniref:ABC transporter domain-containing protein n=1 Tax=Trichoderma breve TaxID=2034170 RepID=A0A9W9BH41_9HYPO|nr:ABC transporter domain-containing protein [Trichoderma breve]KAJ4859436.1 ABC transporter domain-containing protein [Trichoderma breve]
MSVSACANDDAFGPAVEGCRGNFDFTVAFEKIILSILPSACLVILAALRLVSLSRQPHTTANILLRNVKVVLLSGFSATQIAVLVVLAKHPETAAHSLSLGAAAITLLASILAIGLSYLEHSRSLKPSILLESFLFSTLLFDIVQVRTIWLSQQRTLAIVFTVAVAIKTVNFCLEATPKSQLKNSQERKCSPEITSGIFSIGVFSWLNSLLFRGYRGTIATDDLYPLDATLKARRLHDKLTSTRQLQDATDEQILESIPLKKLCWALLGPFLYPIPARLLLLALKLCQPFFIDGMLEFLGTPEELRDKNHGYGLIAASILIYAGIAISSGTTEISLAAGKADTAITLMSTDLDRVAIGCFLLQRQVGVSFVSPIAVIAVCCVLTTALGKPINKRLGSWMGQIEQRVSATATTVAKMKSYKISGLAEVMGSIIQSLREKEIRIGLRFRWLIICTITLGAVPSAFSPLITFAVTSTSRLNVSTIFTSYSYIVLITLPFTIIFNNVPIVIAAFTCIGRIRSFLVSDPRVDFRSWASEAGEGEKESGLAFKVEDGTFGWTADKSVLTNMSCEIPLKALTIIIGPIASGKSTLCKVLLGEIPIHSGKVSVFLPRGSSIGYCQQEPFLYNDTLKHNIVGRSDFNQKKYDEIIAATLLDVDIRALERGSDTMMGSSGSTLSGGQKQRVAIARALYSEAKTLIFDDVMSGLDASTASKLFQRVFAPGGFVRRNGITAVLCTHAVGHLPAADHVIVLGADGAKADQGHFEQLVESNEYVQKLDIKTTVTEVQEPLALETSASELSVPKPKLLEDSIAESPSSDKGSPGSSTRGMGDWAVSNFGVIWLNYWSQDSFGHERGFYIGIYALLQSMFLISWILSAIEIFISMTTWAGAALHKEALQTVVTAPLRYLTTTDVGVITNHFSQDLTLIDGELLFAFFSVALTLTESFGMMIVIATAAPYLAIGFPFLFATLYVVQRFYLKTSRQMRLLDLEAKSPLYTHFLDTTKGIATVRAFGWTPYDIDHNDNLLDSAQQPAYLLAMIQQWLRVVMQLIVAGLALLLVSLATQLESNVGLAGTSLVSLLSFGSSLSELVQNYTDLETCIGAVSRLKTFSASVTPEDRLSDNLEPPESWPTSGAVELKHVSASYSSDDAGSIAPSESSQRTVDLVLHDVSLSILPGQKVAVCGRTGSGKSTLMLLLLRLLDPLNNTSMTLTIDQVPLCEVKRGTLRQRVIALSQEATFLPDGNTIRQNIDPRSEATDAACLSVLDVVGLAKFVSGRGGLDASMKADDLSMGERQLFCLGRAILRKRIKDQKTEQEKAGGVLLLDEVSSSVDHDTDRRLQEIIKAEFENYTVIAVSHRLQTVVDYSDRVFVLDGGRLVESGTPQALIATPGSYFGELWKNDGVKSSTDNTETNSATGVVE